MSQAAIIEELTRRVAALAKQVRFLETAMEPLAIREATAPYLVSPRSNNNVATQAIETDDIRRERNEQLIRLLDSWVEEGDEQEQRETWEYLKKALDEDRPSYRKLFP